MSSDRDTSPPEDSMRGESASDHDARRPRVVRSEELLGGCREIWIEHGEEMYRLRLTSSGKLYLTK